MSKITLELSSNVPASRGDYVLVDWLNRQNIIKWEDYKQDAEWNNKTISIWTADNKENVETIKQQLAADLQNYLKEHPELLLSAERLQEEENSYNEWKEQYETRQKNYQIAASAFEKLTDEERRAIIDVFDIRPINFERFNNWLKESMNDHQDDAGLSM